jgi:eukaryotic-like serine/threonine-protein kinase
MTEDAGMQQRLRALVDEAARKSPSAIQGLLGRADTDDPDLRDALHRLLEGHPQATAALEQLVTFTSPAALADEEFPGTERFVVLKRLGAGGMGVVYEAEDRARGEIVALKTLRHATPAAMYRLKQEFRSLADVAHPNVVCLYELFVEESRCFFTMELVHGVNLVDYVRGGAQSRLSIDRLKSALGQLVQGLSAVHRLGKLHRDIKPSNILVTPAGRVVILDFGLITELFPDTLAGAERVIGGTPEYVSPEEGSRTAPTEAGDWYGVGATLYEALTGRVPFAGPPIEVLFRKRLLDPPPPALIAPEVPADLSAACMGLLCREPSQRLSGPEALITLGHHLPSSLPSGRTLDGAAQTPFVGRRRELDVLDAAFAMTAQGRAAPVCVSGPSGIGKTALVRSFVSGLTTRADLTVFAGRCFEHESVPYKAIDGVVDSLSRFLVALPDAETESVLPDEIAALPRLFPVMRRVPAIERACQARAPAVVDPVLLRRLAFGVLRELLARIARRQPVVIVIDDLQWADVDGVLLIGELLRTPDAPALLALMSFRSEEMAGNPFLRKLLERADADGWTHLALGPLPNPEAHQLVSALLAADSTIADRQRERITREAGGSPFLLEQLVRHAQLNTPATTGGPTFAEMIHDRLDSLPDDARRFLETLALCGRPIAPELICAACGISRERQSLVATMRSSHWIRSSGSSERVETYHDRIREVVAAQIAPAAARNIHGVVASVLLEHDRDDCEVLFEHYRGAGDVERASIQAGLAGAKAASALAFDRAAFFYEQALSLAPASPAAGAWRECLANALANAGRPAEAAEAYLHAATGVEHARRVDLQRRGAEQFLIGGHIDRGLELIRTMLAAIGVDVPRTPRAALLSVLRRRLQLRYRGLRFRRRGADDIDRDTLLRIDMCWSAATGLMLVDLITATDFSARHLLLALDAGEPSRIARGMAIESVAWSAIPTGGRLSARLARESKALAKTEGSSQAIALSILADGLIATAMGQWKEALRLAEEALTLLRDQTAGMPWETNIAQNVRIWALLYLGELREIARQVPVLLEDARSRGNLYIATELCTRSNYAWLATDRPDEGEREALESIERWSQKGFHRQHYSAMLARVQTALYRGDPQAAWRLLAGHEPIFRRSLLTRVQVLRVEWFYLRGRAALAMAAGSRDSRLSRVEDARERGRLLSIARSSARRIARDRKPWSDPIALLLQAGIASVEGHAQQALCHLHAAADRFERADMGLYLAVTRRRIGALQKDQRARSVERLADEWMATQQIKNPACMTRMLAPGFPDEGHDTRS